MSDSYQLIVIGAGPGGYVAAIRAAQLGMKVACVDEHERLGGTCLRVGCIPSKALLESSHQYYAAKSGSWASHGIKVGKLELDLDSLLARKDKIVKQLTSGIGSLFKKHGIEHLHGRGRLAGDGTVEVIDADGKSTTVRATNILIATGSVPAAIPSIELDGDRIGTSTEALAYPEVPARLAVIGAGYIGLEMGSVWARLGAEVTVLEATQGILPQMDREVADRAKKVFGKQGLKFELGVKVTGAKATKKEVTVTYERDGKSHDLAVDRLLVATGRRPNTKDLGLERAGVGLDERGFIRVDTHYRTAAKGVWAIGDVIGGLMLAHKASEEGVAVAENMAGSAGHVAYEAVPGVVYTHPEIASVGKTEEQLKDSNVPYRVGRFPFAPNGRAKAMGETEGFVKILAHAETDRILGFHIIGPHASELVAEAAVAVEFRASAEDLARSVHAHPTLAEVIKEAALDVDGRALHM